MIHELKSDKLTVKIDELGAELKSARAGDEEYMWSGDPKYWEDVCPVLFPICGRLLNNTYTLAGKSYNMNPHGFAPKSHFEVTKKEDSRLTLTLKENEETLKQYPFSFTLTADYTLLGDTLSAVFTVKNDSDRVMPYMFGWHPGFSLPLEGGDIEDFRVKMPGKTNLKWHKLQHVCFASPVAVDFPIENEEYVVDEEVLYAYDTMIFADAARVTELYSPRFSRKITLSYSDNLPYYCIWKEAVSDARFLCLEPWSGTPADGETPENFDTRKMSRLLPGECESYSYQVKFN